MKHLSDRGFGASKHMHKNEMRESGHPGFHCLSLGKNSTDTLLTPTSEAREGRCIRLPTFQSLTSSASAA